MSSFTRLLVVTGANKGIGYGIVDGLRAKASNLVVLCSRDLKLGREALAKMGNPSNVELCQLEITSEDSVSAAARQIQKIAIDRGLVSAPSDPSLPVPCVDVLVNNAGFAYKGDIFGVEEARLTLGVNVYGTIRVTDALIPLLRPRARIVTVSSMVGIIGRYGKPIVQRFTHPKLTRELLRTLCDEFVASIAENKVRENGWPMSMYGVSKAAQVAYTKILAREAGAVLGESASDHVSLLRGKGISAVACHPGYVKTDMTSNNGHRTLAEGAAVAIWLSDQLTDEQIQKANGYLFEDTRQLKWHPDEFEVHF